MDDHEPKPSLESLLLEMIANQQSIHDAVAGLYERLNRLEENLSDSNDSNGDGDAFFAAIVDENGEDGLFEDAKQAVIEAGKASTSYLQRKLRIGYSRAVRLMDLLEEGGVIGAQEGSKPREILMSADKASQVTDNMDGLFYKFTKEDFEEEDDDLYEDAKAAVIKAGKASVSLLQAKLRVGYSRAARLLDLLEENGVIGLQEGKKTTRKVLIDKD